jgi:hypothetical protein
MDLGRLTEQFLVDNEVSVQSVAQLIEKLLPYCVVRKDGTVDLRTGDLSSRSQVKLVLSARLVASKLKASEVREEVSVEEISQYTGLPKNQASARAKECVDEKFAERSGRGSYRARQHKLDAFLGTLSESSAVERPR